MTAEKTIKAQARQALRGNYLKAVSALMILFVAFFLFDGIASLLGLLPSILSGKSFTNVESITKPLRSGIIFWVSFLLSPFINGYIRVFYFSGKSGNFNLKNSFYYFKKGKYGKALGLNFAFFVRMLIPACIAFLPPMIFTAICSNFAEDFFGTSVYDLFMFILCALSTILTVLWALRYFVVYPASFEYEGARAKDLFAYSKKVMRGRTADAARLLRSYAGWILLSFLVLPIIYTAPYMTQGLCISARWLETNYREEIQR